jgi:hypothetical protein
MTEQGLPEETVPDDAEETTDAPDEPATDDVKNDPIDEPTPEDVTDEGHELPADASEQ